MEATTDYNLDSAQQLLETRNYIAGAIANELETHKPRMFEKYISGTGNDETVASALSRLYQDRLLLATPAERKEWRYEYLSPMQSQATIINAMRGASARFSLRLLQAIPRENIEKLEPTLKPREKDAARQFMQQQSDAANHDKMQPSLVVQDANQMELDEIARRDTLLFACRREIRASTPNGGQFLLAHAYDARSRAIAADQVMRRADEQSRGTVFNALQLPVNLGEGSTLVPPHVQVEVLAKRGTTGATTPLREGLRAAPLGVNTAPAETRAKALLAQRFNFFEHLMPTGGVADQVDRNSPKWDDLSGDAQAALPLGSWQQQIQFGVRASRLMANHQNKEEIRLLNRRILRNEWGYGKQDGKKVESVQWSRLLGDITAQTVDQRKDFEENFFTLFNLDDLISDTKATPSRKLPPGSNSNGDDDMFSVFGWHAGEPDLAPQSDLIFPYVFYRQGAIAGSAVMLYKYAFCMWAHTLMGQRDITQSLAYSIAIKTPSDQLIGLNDPLDRKADVAAVLNMFVGGYPIAFGVDNENDECFYFAMGESFDFRRYHDLVEGGDAIFVPESGIRKDTLLRDLGRFRFASWQPAAANASDAIKAAANQRIAAYNVYKGTMNHIKLLGGDRTSRRTFWGNMRRNVVGGFVAQFLTGLNSMQPLPSFPGMLSYGFATLIGGGTRETPIRNTLVDLAVYLGAEPALSALARSSLYDGGPRLRGALGVLSCLAACGPTRLLVDVARNWSTRYHQTTRSLFYDTVRTGYASLLVEHAEAVTKLELDRGSILKEYNIAMVAMSRVPSERTRVRADVAMDPPDAPSFLSTELQKSINLPEYLAPTTSYSKDDRARFAAMQIGTYVFYDVMPGMVNDIAARIAKETVLNPKQVRALAEYTRDAPGTTYWQPGDMGGVTWQSVLAGDSFEARITPEMVAKMFRRALRGLIDDPSRSSLDKAGAAIARVILEFAPPGTKEGDWFRTFAKTVVDYAMLIFNPMAGTANNIAQAKIFTAINATSTTEQVPSPNGLELCAKLADFTMHFNPANLQELPENFDRPSAYQKVCYALHEANEIQSTLPKLNVTEIPPAAPVEAERGQLNWDKAREFVWEQLISPTNVYAKGEPSVKIPDQDRNLTLQDGALIRAGMQSWFDVFTIPSDTPAGWGPVELVSQLIMGQTGVTHREMLMASQRRAVLYSRWTRGMLLDADKSLDITPAETAGAFTELIKSFDLVYAQLLKGPGYIANVVRPTRNFLLITASILTDPHSRGHGMATYSSLRSSFGLAHTLGTYFEARAILSPFGQLPHLVHSFATAVDRTSFSWEHHFANVDLIQRAYAFAPTVRSPVGLSFPAATLVNAVAIGVAALVETVCESAAQTAEDYFKLALQVLREEQELPTGEKERQRDINNLVASLRPGIFNGLSALRTLWSERASQTASLGKLSNELYVRGLYFWTISQTRNVAHWIMLPRLPFPPLVVTLLQTIQAILSQFDLTRFVVEGLSQFTNLIYDHPWYSLLGMVIVLSMAWISRGVIGNRLWRILVKALSGIFIVVATIYTVPLVAYLIDGLISLGRGGDAVQPASYFVKNYLGWLPYNFMWTIPRFLASEHWWIALEKRLDAILPEDLDAQAALRNTYDLEYWAYALFDPTRQPRRVQHKDQAQGDIIMRQPDLRRAAAAAQPQRGTQHFVSFNALRDDNEALRDNGRGAEWAQLQLKWRHRPSMESGRAQYDLANQNEAILREEHPQLLEMRTPIAQRGISFSFGDVYGDQNWEFLRTAFVDKDGRVVPATGEVDGDVTIY